VSKHISLPGLLVLLLLVTCLSSSPRFHTRTESLASPPLNNQLDPGYFIIFDDDFDGGSTSRWILSSNWVAVEEDDNWYLQGTPNGDARLTSPLVQTDYRFKVDLRIINGWAALHYRQRHGQYTLEVMPGRLCLSKFNGEEWDEGIASGNAPISTNIWHTVEISGTTDHIQVFVDDDLYLDYIDPDPLYIGSIGLSVYDNPSAHVDFDNVRVLASRSGEPVWVQTNGPPGGDMCMVAIDPSSPAILYAGGAGEGIYKSIDGGDHWDLTKIPGACYFRSVLVDPVAPQIVYAVTECGCLYKSMDRGNTWVEISTRPQGGLHNLVQSPHALGLLLGASASEKIYTSTDGGASWLDITGDLPLVPAADLAIAGPEEYWVAQSNRRDGGLYHTTDGGVHWTRASFDQPLDTDVISVLVAPNDPQTVYVGLGNVHNEGRPPGHNYLFKTTDGGITWEPITYNFDPDSGYWWFMGQGPDGAIYLSQGFRLWRSTDKGETWTYLPLTGLPTGAGLGDYTYIAIDPTNPDILYLPLHSTGIARSTDGGATWALINEGLLNTTICLLAAHPTKPGTLYAASAGGEGTFLTTDYGEHWTWLNGRGITHPFADELVISPHDPETVWEVVDIAQVFETTNGGMTWEMIINACDEGFRFGSVYAIGPAPSDSDTIYALKNGFGIFKSTNGGEGWRFLHQSEVDYTYSIAVHPTDPDIVYSGYNPKPFQDWAMVRQTTDGGISWRTALSVPHASAITSVAIDPNNPDTVYAGSTGEGGRLWVSHDGGDSWVNVNEHFNFTNFHVMTADPIRPDIAYAGVWGGGTFKTTDGGQNWRRLPNDPTLSASAILVDPIDPDVIYLADRTAPRIYRTTNGGDTWQIYFDAGQGYYRVMTATLAPSDPGVLYASIFRYGGPMAGDVFRIEHGSGTKVTGTLPRLPVALTVDPTEVNTVYAVLHGYGVYRTTDGGQNWDEISGAGSGLPQSPHVGFSNLVIDSHDTDTLYLLGGCDVDVDFSHTGADPSVMNTVYKSLDGGATWTNLNDGTLGTGSGSIKGLAISPIDSNVLYAGALQGVFRSIDGGASWADISAGLGYTHTAGVALSASGARLYAPTLGGGVYAGDVNTSTYDVIWDAQSHLTATIYNIQVAVDPSDSQTIYASAYPGGTFKSVNSGLTWAECNFGMASFEIDDPNRQGYYAFAIAPSDPAILYLGLYGVGMYKSTDGAGTWRPMNGAAQTMLGKTITSLLIDPTDAGVVYVATEDGVYRTSDGGLHWSEFSTGLDCPDIRVLARGSDGRLYAGSRGYELYCYDEPGTTWRQMNAFTNFGTFWPIWNNRPLYQYTSLLFHPTDPNIIYFGTFPAGIYKSTDKGQSWRESNVGWTNDGVFCLVFHPENPNIIYAGTYNGLNRSTDGGDHWEMWDNGWPGEQWVFSIAFDPRDPNVMYACSKNGENEGNGIAGFHGTVMKSTDGGAHWFPITTDLNIDQEFYKIIVDRYDPDTLYLATQSEGVFISRDGGAHWLAWNEGLTNLAAGTNGNNVTNTMVLSADGAYLYFGSAGSGVFRRMTVIFDRFLYLPLILKTGL